MNETIKNLQEGNQRILARSISMVENETDGYDKFLQQLDFSRNVPLIGITGPPGAGKSTLISSLCRLWVQQNKKVAIIAIDPSSPFTRGSILGDRLRMSEHFLHPNVFIRSMASRGSLGGLAPKIFEVADVLRASNFDYIIIETVGVGQSEVEIASLADTTVLVLVPEAGDEIQTMKSGVLEIADVFVVNKSDRDGADMFAKNLEIFAHSQMKDNRQIPVIKTVATKNEGTEALDKSIVEHILFHHDTDHKTVLLAEKAMMMIRNLRTRDLKFETIKNVLEEKLNEKNFNLYRFVQDYVK